MTVKISNLPAATSVGSGDVLPVVQSGTTKKIDLNSPWSINIDGGNIDGTPIGVSSASTGQFTEITGTAVTQSSTDTTAGRLLKVGDFGVGDKQLRDEGNLDMNAPPLATGFYGYDTTAANRPTSERQSTIQLNWISNPGLVGYHQMAFEDKTNTTVPPSIRIRSYKENETPQFTDWQELYHTGNIGNIDVASGDFSVDVSGSPDLFIEDGTGNVGIGTTSPSSYSIDSGVGTVIADTSASAELTLASSTTGKGNVAFADGTSGSERYRGLIQYDHTNDFMRFYSAGSERMRIDSSGNVGIKTTSIDVFTTLDVQTSSTGRSWSSTVGVGDLLVERNGNVGLSLIAANSSASSLNFGDTDDQNAGFITYLHSSNDMTFRTNGSGEAMRIDSSGNVGIGTTLPARKLHVKDVMRLEPRATAPSSPAKGDIYFDSSDDKLKCYDGTTWQNLY